MEEKVPANVRGIENSVQNEDVECAFNAGVNNLGYASFENTRNLALKSQDGNINLGEKYPDGNESEEKKCSDGNESEEKKCPDGNESEEKKCPDGNESEEKKCPDGKESEEKKFPDGNESEELKSMEDIINAVGRGVWTYLFLVIASAYTAVEVVNLLGSEFQVPPLEFMCSDDWQFNNSTQLSASTQCDATFTNENETEVIACQNFIYNTSTYVTSVTAEFNLVCGRDFLRGVFKSTYIFGCIFGCTLGGAASDKFGRQPVLFYSTLIMTVLTVLLVIIPNLEVILIIRFLLGATTMVVTSAAYTIAMEGCPSSMRSGFAIAVAFPFAAMIVVLALIAYLAGRWREIQLIASFPLYLLLICANPIFLKESPRWLVERGRIEEAEIEIRRAGKLNKTSHNLPANLLEILTNIHSAEKKASSRMTEESFRERMLSMIIPVAMRKLTLVTLLLWFCQGCVYISMPYRSSIFQSPFLYFAILGLVEMPAYACILPVVLKFKRRLYIASGFSAIAVLLLTSATLEALHVDNVWLSMSLSALIYVLVCTAYMVNLVFCSELFPTSVRSTGTSLAMLTGNIGFNVPVMLATILPADLAWVTQVVLASLAAACVGVVFLLPESKDRPLLQTVQEYVQLQENPPKKHMP